MTMTKAKGPISNFIEKYYLHFNAAALVDAAKGYEAQLEQGSKMLVSLAGAMSTAELGKIFAEVIRQDKVQIISCTCANLEEDIMNLISIKLELQKPEQAKELLQKITNLRNSKYYINFIKTHRILNQPD